MRIPIATKLITVTSVILIASTSAITWISSSYFERKASEQVDISNLESAAAKAKEIENILGNILEKTRVNASILMKESAAGSGTPLDDINFNFLKDKNFISIEVLKVDGNEIKSVTKRIKESELTPFQLEPKYISHVRSWQKFPLQSVAKGQIEIKNGSYPKGPALVTVGVPLIRDEQGLITHIAIADVQLSSLLKPFADPSERTQFFVDKSGEVIAHKDEKKAMARLNLSANPFMQKVLNQKSQQFQTKYTDPESKIPYFAAAVKTSYGQVISQTSEATVLEVSYEVRRRAIFVAGTAISAAIFFIFLFSMTLTSPIEKLAGLIHLVSQGNFDVQARGQVKSQDEVGDLAIAFDQMTEGLKERDKVKSLFSKFHGSSVAEDLISKDIGVGGQSKEVVVFFSDIRGFTAFSENRSPEEVVEMLNEYFAVMVKIVNQNGGVVDKFIGDAIMAAWGVPSAADDDAHRAVKACLEMRQALEILNQSRIERSQPPINIGMGLHAGKAISGTIGSDERMEYTVIGNTVNTASRIEASTKAFGTDLLISDSVVALIGEKYIIDMAGSAEVKGRTEALNMYKVRGYIAANGDEIEIKTPYSEYEAEKVDKVKVQTAA